MNARKLWYGWTNGIVLTWLAFSAALAAASSAGSTAVPAWLGVHTLLLGAATTAIVVWGEHFAVAVAHAPSPGRRWPATRVGLLTVGQLSVVGGAVAELTWLFGAGAVLVTVAVAAHGGALWRWRRTGLGGRLAGIIDYYLVACVSLVAGAVLGGLMGSGVAAGEPWRSRIYLAHTHLNLGGWVGLTVVGTLFMLLPTTLRTMMEQRTQRAMRWCLRLAGPGLAVAVAGLLAGSRLVAVAGLLAYLAGLAVAASTFAATVRRKRPRGGPSWMLTAAMGWLAVAVVFDLIAIGSGRDAAPAGLIGPILLVGVVAQVLIGSLTYLLPVVIGGGPAAVRASSARLDRWWPVRPALLNAAVVLLVIGGGSGGGLGAGFGRAGWLIAALAVADFAVRAVAEVMPRSTPDTPSVMAGAGAGVVITGLAVLVATSGTAVPEVGQAHVVEVRLESMRVDPPVISVPHGTNLTLRVSNVDGQAHDLRTGDGRRTALLRQGDTAMLPIGRVTGEITAWCTVAGHRAAGMSLQINASGHAAEPGGFEAHDASLPAATPKRVELSVVDKVLETTPGVTQPMWTFNGSVPGPVLRGKVGDVFEVTLRNNGSLGHGIDFHAGALAPDGPMRTIQPGESLVYRFRAERAGAWMYHCSTAPMTQHIGAGMFGAVIIDPPDLAPAAREYLLVASEQHHGEPGHYPGTPGGWAFNGVAHQYDHSPLTAAPGERVRFWLVNAGPGGTVSFHIVGAQFDTTYLEGGYLLRPGPGGAQSLALAPAQGGFVELSFPEAGHYAFVDHDMRHAEGGAHGMVVVR